MTNFAAKVRNRAMFYLFPPEFGFCIVAVLIVFLIKEGIHKMTDGYSGNARIEYSSPFIEQDVKPVSEGDRVAYAFYLEEKYTACIENEGKHAKLDLEADSKEELEKKFMAWAVVGKKRQDWPF